MKGLTERFLQGDKAALQLLNSESVVAAFLTPSTEPTNTGTWVAEYKVGDVHYVELVEKNSPRIKGLYANFILGDLADIVPLRFKYFFKDKRGVWRGSEKPPTFTPEGELLLEGSGSLVNLNIFVREEKLPKGEAGVIYMVGSKDVSAPTVTHTGVMQAVNEGWHRLKPQRQMTSGALGTYSEFKSLGWTDEQMEEFGFLEPLEDPTERLTEELDELKEEDDRWETFIGGPLDGQKVLGWEKVGTLIFQLGGQRGHYDANLKWHSQ